MIKSYLQKACVFLLPCLLLCCTSVPKATVELSEIVDEQIKEMQRSHESFVSLYYDKLREDIETFMVEEWIPTFLANTLAGETEQSKKLLFDIDNSYKLMKIDPKAVRVIVDSKMVEDDDVQRLIKEALRRAVDEQKAQFGKVMLGYSRSVQKYINKQRADMIKPIKEQETFVLSELRDGYSDLLRGNAAIKGYLASAVKLTEERNLVLAKLGLLETQQKIVDTAVKANDDLISVLADVKDIETAIGTFKEKMDKTKKELEIIKAESSPMSGKNPTK